MTDGFVLLSEVSGTVPIGEAITNILSNPLSIVLLLFGGLVTAFAVGTMAYMAAAGLLAGVSAE